MDVGVRIRVLNEKLGYASEIAEVLRETLRERHDVRLEWIIILLIAVEVAFEMGRWVGEWREKRDPGSEQELLKVWLRRELEKQTKGDGATA